MPEMPSLAEEMLASQEGMCCVEMFRLSVECHDHFSPHTRLTSVFVSFRHLNKYKQSIGVFFRVVTWSTLLALRSILPRSLQKR